MNERRQQLSSSTVHAPPAPQAQLERASGIVGRGVLPRGSRGVALRGGAQTSEVYFTFRGCVQHHYDLCARRLNNNAIRGGGGCRMVKI